MLIWLTVWKGKGEKIKPIIWKLLLWYASFSVHALAYCTLYIYIYPSAFISLCGECLLLTMCWAWWWWVDENKKGNPLCIWQMLMRKLEATNNCSFWINIFIYFVAYLNKNNGKNNVNMIWVMKVQVHVINKGWRKNCIVLLSEQYLSR
jgi:hypothetical protein